MADNETIEIEGQTIVIDPGLLHFSEATLSEYIQREAAYYDNIGYYLTVAEKNLQNKQMMYEKIYGDRYAEYKEHCTGPQAEAKAKADDDVMAFQKQVIEAQYIVKRLQRHLKAWDLNHDNAKSMGYRLCKEIDKLNADIYARGHGVDPVMNSDLDNRVEATITHVDPATDTIPEDLEIG